MEQVLLKTSGPLLVAATQGALSPPLVWAGECKVIEAPTELKRCPPYREVALAGEVA